MLSCFVFGYNNGYSPGVSTLGLIFFPQKFGKR